MKKAFYILILILTVSCKKEKKEINPLVIEFHNKGIEYQFENKKDSAIVYFKKALEIQPTDITTIESLIKIYWINGQPELALQILKKTPEEIKESNSILILKGMTHEKMGKLNEAMELYKKAFKESPIIEYKNEQNLMEFIGYLTLQTIVGEKDKAMVEFNKLKEKKLTESEKHYVNSIELIIKNYKSGGYNAIFGNE